MKLFYLRKAVQLTVLLMILLIAFNVVCEASLALPWLSRFSPLMTISTRLAARQWTPYFCGGVLVGFMCLLFPRLFCGWLCPIGTCIDLVDTVSFAKKRRTLILSCWTLAFLIFLGLFTASALGYNVAGYADPLTITGHAASAINTLSTEDKPFMSSYYSDAFNNVQIIMSIVFCAILLMTILGRRSWCRILCPLGGFLGVLATVSLNRRSVSSECINCGKCRQVCRMRAIGTDFTKTEDQLCIYCNDCQNICPKKAISFK
jgi:polyferredoxin